MLTKSHHHLIPAGIGFLLWSISGILTVTLFLDLVGSNLFKVILAILWAGGLEASKILSWRWGGRYRILSLALMAVTLFSALGMALSTVETTQAVRVSKSLKSSPYYIEESASIRSLQAQITDDVHRLQSLPPDWITVAAGIRTDLASLRNELSRAQAKLTALFSSPSPDAQTPMALLARSLGLNRKALEVTVILILAILTEASAAVMAGYRSRGLGQDQDTVLNIRTGLGEDQDRSPNFTQSLGEAPNPILNDTQSLGVTPEIYLKTALDHPNAPRLLGRLEVAKRLGITEAQARSLLVNLIKSGKVQRGSKNFTASHPPKASNNL